MATGEFVYRLVQLGREQKRSTASFAQKAHTILMPVSELTRASLLIAVVIACTLGCNSVEFRERLVSADGAAVCIVYALWRFVGLVSCFSWYSFMFYLKTWCSVCAFLLHPLNPYFIIMLYGGRPRVLGKFLIL